MSRTDGPDERQRFLAALQLADSALPVGRFAHSLGLEALLAADPSAGEPEIAELVETVVLESAGPLDGVAIALAHRARSLAELCDLDACVTARKLTPGARLASTSCGRQLAALVPTFTEESPAVDLASTARDGLTDGNLAVVHGALAAALGLSAGEAVLVELRGVASGLLSAAVRLGRLSALRAQALQVALAPAIAEACRRALNARPESMSSTTLELDVYALRHARLEARSFIT